MDLVAVLLEPSGVRVDRGRLYDLHPALDASKERVSLVTVEVVPGDGPQRPRNLRQHDRDLIGDFSFLLARGQRGEATNIERDLCRDLIGREQQVDDSRGLAAPCSAASASPLRLSAIDNPPYCFVADTPAVPSLPRPLRMTATDRSWACSASDMSMLSIVPRCPIGSFAGRIAT